jgi:radical SAM protein with 4Fe4S-binding SPASM domain
MYIDEDKCKLLKEYSIPYVGVSIDVGVQEVESKLRVGVDLDRLFTTIRLLRKYDIQVGIRSVLTLTSAYTIEHLVKICRKLDVKRLCIYNIVPTGRAKYVDTALKLDDELYVRFLLYLMTRIVPENRDIDILMVTEPSTYILACLLRAETKDEFYTLVDRYKRRCACSAGVKIVSIYPDGTYNPCQFYKIESRINVKDTPLDVALRQLQELYGNIKCEHCPFSDLCRGCIVKMQERNITYNPDCVLLKLYRTGMYEKLKDWKRRLIEDTVQTVLKATVRGS